MQDATLERLHRALVAAIKDKRNGEFGRPVTVAEIYQELIPYRVIRGTVGFDMNADYEHTLLRLLAGEQDFAQIEPAEVREQLRLELESPNPNVSLFRNFANCDVFVAVQQGEFAERVRASAPPTAESAAAPSEAGQAAETAPDVIECPHCSAKFAGQGFRFCPSCGHELGRRQCSNCQETLEPGWRFCAFCGTSVTQRA